MLIGRRKRAVDADELLRVKRQAPCPPVEEEDYDTCQGLYSGDQTICDSDTVRSICCNFCNVVDQQKAGESAPVDLPAPSKRVELQPITKQSQPKRLWDYLSHAIDLNWNSLLTFCQDQNRLFKRWPIILMCNWSCSMVVGWQGDIKNIDIELLNDKLAQNLENWFSNRWQGRSALSPPYSMP